MQRVERMWCNIRLSAALSAFLIISTLNAQSFDSPPKEVVQTIPNGILLGTHRLEVLFFDVYDAALWAEKKPWSFDQKFALSLRYLSDISKSDIVDTSIEEMARHKPLGALEPSYRAMLETIFVNVSAGDRITAVFVPTKGLTFYLNGTVLGKINDLNLATQFISIWLHPNASYGEMRSALLGIR